jgi:DNA polymerase-3 subunit gamma/tau
MLSTGAFNALLKTLEEPPSYVIFILATTEVHKIPITVLSRCQRYDFKRITVDTITEHLKELTETEQIRVEEKALTYIAKSADGALRDALSLLDQCIAFHYGELLTYDNVLDVLGAVDITVFGRLFQAVAKNNTKECITCLEDMVIQGRELGQFVVDFIWYLRNLLIIKSVDEAENLLDMSSENQIQLREDSALADHETLLRYIRVFSDLSNQLRYASQKRVLIEVALIKLTRPQMEQNYDSILQRIKSIEQQLESGTFLQKGEGGAPSSADAGSDSSELETLTPAQRVALPQGQLEDLNLIRGDWGKIIKDLGGPIRASFRETIVEPAGESRLCVVFSDQSNYLIGSRESTIEEIERYVQDHYKKSIAFQTRLQGGNERMDTIYVSDEELKANIQMDITIEE